MKIYNTLTKKIEEFIPSSDVVTMYTCGPTVYDYAHIGNLRTYIFNDVLERTLNYLGYNVKRVLNLTDVGHMTSDADFGDDKMVKSALEQKKSVLEIADFYADAFFDDFKKLNIIKPSIIKKASDHIDIYINMISKLIEDGYAYVSGNVYFDITKMKNYYELSGRNPLDQFVGVRSDVEEDECKRNQGDFVLWFTNSKFEDHILKWDSPWGEGYPGWHIECSGLALEFLGDKLDIHTGGIDLVFPHHTNEIAQSEGYLGHKWCNYWVHGEFLNDITGKMSKSKGEFLTLSLLESKNYNPLSYRYMCLTSHYRKTLTFSYEQMDKAENEYGKLKSKVLSIKNDNKELQKDKIDFYKTEFKNALSDDLNTSLSITTLYNVLKDNTLNASTKLYLITDFDKVLGLDLLKVVTVEIDFDLKQYIDTQIKIRNKAKEEKNYELADKIRDELKEKGIILKDKESETTYEMEG